MQYKGRERDYQRDWARARRAKRGIKPKTIFCSEEERAKAYVEANKRWRARNRIKVNANAKHYNKMYREQHLEEQRQMARSSYQRRVHLWREGMQVDKELVGGNHWFTKNGKLIWEEAEYNLGRKILLKEGFTDLFEWWFRHKKPFDFLAKKNGQPYAFDVTTAERKRLSIKSFSLAMYLGISYFIIFVKPDLSGRYFIKFPSKSHRAWLTLSEMQQLKSL